MKSQEICTGGQGYLWVGSAPDTKLKQQFGDAKERVLTTGLTAEVRDVEGQLKEVYEREEIMQKQRS